MKLSLVISTYNQPVALEKCLLGVRHQTVRPAEILIADDGSDAATADLIRQFTADSPVPVKHLWQAHQGFRKTIILNRTIAAATGDYLVFTDCDCVPHPQFVADHQALAEPGYWVQGRRCFVQEKNVPAFVPGRTPVWWWMLTGKITGIPKGIRWPVARIQRDQGQRGIIGCNMAYWREDLVAVNGFDEAYLGWGGEDSDLGTRVYHLGRTRKFVYGRAITFHLNHPVLSRAWPTASREHLAETIRTRKVRCQQGLNRHG